MKILAEFPTRHPRLTGLALSLGAAIALGFARFAYGLLLPPMRQDLDWSYLLAGSMTTWNALGYLAGALLAPLLLRHLSPWSVLVLGSVLTSLFMAAGGFATGVVPLLVQRALCGLSSAFIFVSGGLLASRLATLNPRQAGLLLGLYYGGAGIGITLSAVIVPLTIAAADSAAWTHPWQLAWIALGLVCLLATGLIAVLCRAIPDAPNRTKGAGRFSIGAFGFGLAGYFLFGMGYIGYMTFVVALLRDQGVAPTVVFTFFGVLGLAVVASSKIWARMLDHFKGGGALAILNTLVGLACIIPAVTARVPVIFASGLLFGATFFSAVASTTAIVRHNLPPQSWPAGITAFTTVFALGQIVGPSVVGWIGDHFGGLDRGLLFSAVVLFVGALLAWGQKPLRLEATP